MSYSLIGDEVGGQVEVEEVDEGGEVPQTGVYYAVLGYGQLLKSGEVGEVAEEAVAQVVGPQVQHFQLLEVADVGQRTSSELIVIQLQFLDVGEAIGDDPDACVSDLIVAQDERLQSSEGLQLQNVLISYLLAGQVDLFCLLSHCSILDGDQRNRPRNLCQWRIPQRIQIQFQLQRDVVDGGLELGIGIG